MGLFMYKKFFAFCFLMTMACPAYAYKVKSFQPLAVPQYQQTTNPLAPQYQDYGVNESYPKISQLEFNLFRRTYENENIYSRLTRLENRIFRRSFTGMPLATRVDNILANVDAGLMYGISSKELGRLEMKVLGRTYMNDDTESRITRLEKEMLGAMQGGNLKSRFATVTTASKHYNSYPELAQSQKIYPKNYENSPYSPYSTKYNYSNGMNNYGNTGVNGIFQKIAGAFFGDIGNGSFTGMTPPIYDPYNPYGTNSGMGQQDYSVGNTGGYIRSKNLGNGGSVRILD